MALNVPNASTATHAPDADGWVTCGTLRVRGGTYGTDFIYYPDMFQYPKEDGTVVSYGFVGYGGYAKADCILVLTSTPLTFKTPRHQHRHPWTRQRRQDVHLHRPRQPWGNRS